MRKVKSSSRPILKKCLNLSLSFLFAGTFASAAIPTGKLTEKTSVESHVRGDLAEFRKQKRSDFQELIRRWDTVYGTASAPFLLKIAKDAKANNSDRYVAILAHTRILGPSKASELVLLLDDRDWMVRSAALKSIEILGYTAAAPKVLEKLASDPALVIRLQAIETLNKLRPTGLADALLRAAMDGQNYRPANFRTGRADWVPQKALEALRELRPAGYARKLLPLLNEMKDGRMRAHALHTIESLESKTLKSGRPFAERAAAWNQKLQASR